MCRAPDTTAYDDSVIIFLIIRTLNSLIRHIESGFHLARRLLKLNIFAEYQNFLDAYSVLQ